MGDRRLIAEDVNAVFGRKEEERPVGVGLAGSKGFAVVEDGYLGVRHGFARGIDDLDLDPLGDVDRIMLRLRGILFEKMDVIVELFVVVRVSGLEARGLLASRRAAGRRLFLFGEGFGLVSCHQRLCRSGRLRRDHGHL